MEEAKVNITVGENQKTPVIVHLLKGQAPRNIEPRVIDIHGDIDAVSDFISTRESTLEKNRCHIMMNLEAKTILLVIDENSEFAGNVVSKLEIYPDLIAFGINSGKRFTRTEVEKLIRMNRFYFPDKDDHLSLMASFKNFSAKIQAEIQQSADQRGNKVNNSMKNVQSDLVESFAIQIPIFKGGLPRLFRVEICFDVSDSTPSFWFESVELFELEKTEIENAFTDKKRQFIEKGFTVISC